MSVCVFCFFFRIYTHLNYSHISSFNFQTFSWMGEANQWKTVSSRFLTGVFSLSIVCATLPYLLSSLVLLNLSTTTINFKWETITLIRYISKLAGMVFEDHCFTIVDLLDTTGTSLESSLRLDNFQLDPKKFFYFFLREWNVMIWELNLSLWKCYKMCQLINMSSDWKMYIVNVMHAVQA